MESPNKNLETFNDAERRAYLSGRQSGEITGRFLGHAIVSNVKNEELSAANRELKHRATHDKLTGVLNRAGFEEYLEENSIVGRVVFFVDGTNVKKINDKMGHEAGDRTIKGTAEVLTAVVRESDVVARVGGDEFMVVMAPIQREGKLIPSDEEIPLITGNFEERTAKFLEANEDLAAQGFDIAVGGVVGVAGSTIDSLKQPAEAKMMQHKGQQHAVHGAYRSNVA